MSRCSRGLLIRAGLLGVASGSRSMSALAALSLTASTGWLASPASRVGFAGAAGIELVIDKLPVTPSRLVTPGLVSRLVTGAASAALLARRENSPAQLTLAAAAVGGGTAVGFAFAGVGWRRWAKRRWGVDLPGAVAEDVASATVALVGAAL